MTDSDYLSAFHQVVLPLAAEFQPQLVLVSAGFDPALGCPEGEQRVSKLCSWHESPSQVPKELLEVTFTQVSPATFAHLLHSLQPFAGGRVLALLEGGYFLPSLAGDCRVKTQDVK